jgi:hypothetical protein
MAGSWSADPLNVSKLLAPLPRASHTYRLDFSAMLFTGAVLACINMLDVIGAKAYGAGSFEVALIRSGMGLGMIASYWVATRIIHSRRVPFVIWPQAVSRILLASLLLIPWLPGEWVLPFFCFCAVLASALEHLNLPARLTLYRHNYPIEVRPLVASRVRQGQVVMLLLVGAGLGMLLDWNRAEPEGLGRRLADILPRDLLPPGTLLWCGIPIVALLSFAGVFLFARIKEGARLKNAKGAAGKAAPGLREWAEVMKKNRSFLVFEIAYFLFGFGNLMTMPLLVILITKKEYGIEASYFEAMLVQVVIWQVGIFVAAPFMARLVGSYNPILLRGLFTLFFAVDLVLVYAGYLHASLTPLYIGKAIRGISMAGGMLIWELGPMYFARNKEEVPTYVGIHTVLTGVRALVSPWVGASLAGLFTLGTAVLAGVALQVFAGFMLIFYFLAAKHEPLLLKDAPKTPSQPPTGPVT